MPLSVYDSLVARKEVAPDDGQRWVAARLDALARGLEARQQRAGALQRLLGLSRGSKRTLRGLYVWGDVGRGKTMLMDLFHASVAVSAKRRVHFHAFMQEVHQGIHRWRRGHKGAGAGGNDPIAPVADAIAAEARLLCFDEFQVTDITDAMLLGRLFEALLARGVLVVTTSNTPPDELYRDGLNRGSFLPFIALLKAELDIVTLNGRRDYRLDRLRGEQVYLTPLGAESDVRIEAIWQKLTDAAPGIAAQLEVRGRKLMVPKAAKRVARFTFAELCGQPLGAADYLELAARFDTVILEGIPVLSKDRRNEARRLVILVDALYDKGARLVATAETSPEGLYPHGDASLAFARTVSRLHEMQSEGYLARCAARNRT